MKDEGMFKKEVCKEERKKREILMERGRKGRRKDGRKPKGRMYGRKE